MNENLRAQEREFERQWASLGLDLSVAPPPAVVERIRAAVRHELNEAWLAGQPMPVPDATTLDRVLWAVRRELATFARGRASRVGWRRVLTVGTAAAAAVVLSVGLRTRVPAVRPAGESQVVLVSALDEAVVEQFVRAADRIWQDDPLTGELRTDLDAVEESLGQWSTDGWLGEDLPDDLNSRLDLPDGATGVGGGAMLAGAFG